MKEIDEKFFMNDNIKSYLKGEDFLEKGEKILWRGIPKKSSFVMQKTVAFMPIAIIWGIIDISILTTIFATIPNGFLLFIIPFFALHLMPVWIWIASIVKAKREVEHIEYYITNMRIFELNGSPKYITSSIWIEDLVEAEYKQSATDKFFKVGDIYLISEDVKFVLCDIPNSNFIYSKIKQLCSSSSSKAKSKQQEFYKKSFVCDHCGSYFDESEPKCPNCGAPKVEQK